MTDREDALYRYLTHWCDFTPAEARQYILDARRRELEMAA